MYVISEGTFQSSLPVGNFRGVVSQRNFVRFKVLSFKNLAQHDWNETRRAEFLAGTLNTKGMESESFRIENLVRSHKQGAYLSALPVEGNAPLESFLDMRIRTSFCLRRFQISFPNSVCARNANIWPIQDEIVFLVRLRNEFNSVLRRCHKFPVKQISLTSRDSQRQVENDNARLWRSEKSWWQRGKIGECAERKVYESRRNW